MTSMPYPPYSPDLAPGGFVCLFPQMKKVLKGKRFADMERKNRRQKHENASKLASSKELFWAVEKNNLIGVLRQVGSTLKVTDVWTRKNKYTSFCKEIPGGLGPPLYIQLPLTYMGYVRRLKVYSARSQTIWI